MEKFIDSNPFNFKNVGVVKVFRVMVVDHAVDKKDNKRINYYRLKFLPYMDINGKVSNVSGRGINIINTNGTRPFEKKIIVDANKYLCISTSTMIPIGTELFINTAQLDKDGNSLFNIIWASKYTKKHLPTINDSIAVKNRFKFFIGSNYALKDVTENRPVVVFPGNLLLNKITFKDSDYNKIKTVNVGTTGYMLQTLLNKTSYMIYRYFVSKANELQLFTNDTIDKRILSKILIGHPILPKEASHIEINGKHVDVTYKELSNTKGIRKYVNTIKSYEMEIAPKDRHGPFHVFSSYMFARAYGEDWLDLTYD